MYVPQVLEIKGVSGQKKKSASTKEPDQDLTACSRRREGGMAGVVCAVHRSGRKPAEPVHCTLHSGDLCIAHTLHSGDCTLLHTGRKPGEGKAGAREGSACACNSAARQSRVIRPVKSHEFCKFAHIALMSRGSETNKQL